MVSGAGPCIRQAQPIRILDLRKFTTANKGGGSRPVNGLGRGDYTAKTTHFKRGTAWHAQRAMVCSFLPDGKIKKAERFIFLVQASSFTER
jgi:hypothetical protein